MTDDDPKIINFRPKPTTDDHLASVSAAYRELIRDPEVRQRAMDQLLAPYHEEKRQAREARRKAWEESWIVWLHEKRVVDMGEEMSLAEWIERYARERRQAFEEIAAELRKLAGTEG